MIDITIIED